MPRQIRESCTFLGFPYPWERPDNTMFQPMNHPSDTNETGGDARDILPLVYNQLRALADRRLADEAVGHTLQATALVNEVYLRLTKSDGIGQRFVNRGHFFAAAAEAMRRILIEHARGKKRIKRGGKSIRRDLTNVLDLAAAPDFEEILAFEDAIGRLEGEVPLAAKVVRIRFYAGLSVDETAEALGVSSRTVDREWAYARAWLYRLLGDQD